MNPRKYKVTVEHHHSEIVEVKTCWEENEANALLKSGNWILLHGGVAHRDRGWRQQLHD